MVHERLLTKYKRHKWNTTIHDESNWCMDTEETLVHMIWDCPYVTHVYIRLVPSKKMPSFTFFTGIKSCTISKKIFQFLTKHTRGSSL